MALWAHINKHRLAHIEAGVRCWDLGLVEERNRIAIDGLSDYLLFISELCKAKVLRHPEQSCAVVGDLLYDRYVLDEWQMRKSSSEEETVLPWILVTFHRQENMNKAFFDRFFEYAREGKDRFFFFPMHPRARSFITTHYPWKSIPANIILSPPLDRQAFLRILWSAESVWTDSGGVQREAIFAEKPCWVWRRKNEWEGYIKKDFGDGKAAKHIVDFLEERF